MVRNVNVKSYDTLIKEWREQDFDDTLGSIKKTFNPKKLSKHLYSFGKNFSYIIDHQRGDITYISKSIEDILGYDLSTYKSYGISFLINKIHPQDYLNVLKFNTKTQETFNSLSIGDKLNLRSTYTYRLKNNNNEYLKLLHQHIVLEIDTKGNLVYSLTICTDISQSNSFDHIHINILKLDEKYNLIPLKILGEDIYELFSDRELEVLNKLVMGKNSNDIGRSLGISPHTVNVHRKNMMKKANVNNVTSLISFSREKGII
ncbi:response regulator transcription factor [Chondrinema litorale]|uniref:response regulator transcription factor n=1 Tax=Chondrinema litorale TaxID=2994555 RepID=UPI002542F782|nr:helix-turn-helix transcriptional regulator [Chondrinema litorale]UZS00113.1 helix-turn-helix transcriptional regulator [Chondrinema litorale]